jgi:restriction system protein
MLPLLVLASDGREHRLRDVVELLANRFNLSQQEREKLLPSGRQTVVMNRVGWSKTYLAKAGLLETTRRGFFKISAEGLSLLAENPSSIDE